MLSNLARTVWNLPAVVHPPRRVWRDWVLVALTTVATTVGVVNSGALGVDDVFRVVALGLVVGALLTRRTDRFLAIALILCHSAVDVALWQLTGAFSYSGGMLIFVLYAIARWGSGREILLMSATSFVGQAVVLAIDEADPIGATLVLVTVFAIGIVVRQNARLRDQRLREAQLDERQRIARELHDSVAHHVSGIAVQAKAAQAVATTDPEAATEAMRQVAASASDALVEMRRMVAALRDDAGGDVRPQAGLAAIAELAEHRTAPQVEVVLDGDLDGLEPAVEAGLFRLAQESVTNASRHARHARRVLVRVTGHARHIDLVVADDGETVGQNGRRVDGYGLIGMRERVALLGGTFSAGPGQPRGWRVEATIPRTASDHHPRD